MCLFGWSWHPLLCLNSDMPRVYLDAARSQTHSSHGLLSRNICARRNALSCFCYFNKIEAEDTVSISLQMSCKKASINSTVAV